MGFSIEQYHGSYNRVRRTVPVRYIVVHYTGSGTSKPGSARANCIYFSGGNRNASAHYFIDDAHIFEYADPSAWACWHVGDGHGRYGITNANSVGIEVCNNGGEYTSAEKERLRWLVGQLMARFGVPASRVVRHYDASRKCCPAPYAPNGEDPTGRKWAALHAYITGGAGETTSTGNEEEIVTDADIQKIAEKVWQYAINGTQARDRLQGIDGIVQGLRDQRKPSTMLLMTPTHDGKPLGYLAWWDGSELRMLDQEHQPLAVQKVAAEMGQDCSSVYIEDNWFYRFATAVRCKDEGIMAKAREFFPDESIA